MKPIAKFLLSIGVGLLSIPCLFSGSVEGALGILALGSILAGVFAAWSRPKLPERILTFVAICAGYWLVAFLLFYGGCMLVVSGI